jgi:hypothetical protein
MAKRILRNIALALLILSLLFIWLLLRKPSMPTVEASAAAAQSFDQKVSELAQSQERGILSDIRLTEAEINSKIQEGLRDNPPPAGTATLKGAVVHLEGEKLLAMLTVNVKGKDLYVTIAGGLNFSNHAVRLVPSEVRVGSLPVPASWVEGKIDMHLEVPASVTAVRIENGQLVVQAQ